MRGQGIVGKGQLGRADRVPDEGLQAERTSLAWQRTVLLLVGTAAVVLRLVTPSVGVIAAAAVCAAACVLWRAHRRYRRVVEAVRHDVRGDTGVGPSIPGAGLPAGIAATVILLGVIVGWPALG